MPRAKHKARPWTTRERDQLYHLFVERELEVKEIARLLDRSHGSVRGQIQLSDFHRKSKLVYNRSNRMKLKRKHARGWSDSEIAAYLGCPESTVNTWRRKMGLPSTRRHPHQRERWRQITAERLERDGLESLNDHRRDRWRVDAADQGWPPHMPPTAVEILNLLEQHGAMTVAQIARALGHKVDGRGRGKLLACKRPGGTWTAWLQREGMIESKRGRRNQFTFQLAAGVRRRSLLGPRTKRGPSIADQDRAA